jgi:hypothetical protein
VRPGITLPIETGEVVNDPIDPRFLTDVPFGSFSFWVQPWRAYLDTWPASRLLESVGINFNVNPEQAEATAQLLHDSGFRLARLAIDWPALSYSDPTKFVPMHLANITARLTALRDHGLRPLIVLQAYSGAPTPEKHVTLETTSAAPAGSQTVKLAAASAAQVVPGKTGFNYLVFKGTPDVLVTSVGAEGLATLSRPLPNPLPAGPHSGTTLLYAPFGPPKRADGEPNPEFQATLAGWVNYVAAVSKLAAGIVGPGGFDLEVWNELTFGSQFLNSENYYTASGEGQSRAGAPSAAAGASTAEAGGASTPEAAGASTPEAEDPETDYRSERLGDGEPGYASETDKEESEDEAGTEGEPLGPQEGELRGSVVTKRHKRQVNNEVQRAILEATVAYVRDPANGLSPSVGVTNGFASETPFPSGAAAPVGLTAISKHPYVGAISFPSEYHEWHVYARNAQGELDTSSRSSFKPLFIPTYQSLFPEYTLTATSTETLIRDISPVTTPIYHWPHGREVGPAGGAPVQKWVTEYNLGIGKAPVVGPDEVTPQSGPAATLSTADRAHFHAKALLRSLVSMVGKGMTRDYFFAAAPGAFSLIGDDFFSALEAHPGTYPGDQLGSEVMHSFARTLARFQGPGPSGAARQLKLLSIAQDGNHAQFSGDGTDPHPPLYDRDVLAVLPFQSSPTRFVIPVYVMTRDLLTLYDPTAPASDLTRFDLPDETFRITLGNLPEGGTPPSVSAYDPIRDQSTPARLLSREGETAVVELSATDYPRLLTLEYAGG